MRRQGISEPVLLIPDPEDTTNMIYCAFVGRPHASSSATTMARRADGCTGVPSANRLRSSALKLGVTTPR
jgi:hypothetical protein